MKDVLTTGQVAKICGVVARTATHWIDTGRLPGYRIPGSRDRRIPAGELLRFLRDNGMPVPPELLDAGAPPVLLVGLSAAPKVVNGAILYAARDGFEAGRVSAEHPPAVAVIDATGLGRGAALAIGRALAKLESRPYLIGIPTEDCPGETDWLASGFDRVLPPGTAAKVACAVRDALAVVRPVKSRRF